jgi:hypothetical protein
MAPRGQLVFAVGLGALVFVPAFKALTGLPPYIGILLGLGVLWILTDAIHFGESGRQKLKVPQALSRIDTQGVLFFLGILLSVSRYGCLLFHFYFLLIIIANPFLFIYVHIRLHVALEPSILTFCPLQYHFLQEKPFILQQGSFISFLMLAGLLQHAL